MTHVGHIDCKFFRSRWNLDVFFGRDIVARYSCLKVNMTTPLPNENVKIVCGEVHDVARSNFAVVPESENFRS